MGFFGRENTNRTTRIGIILSDPACLKPVEEVKPPAEIKPVEEVKPPTEVKPAEEVKPETEKPVEI